MGQKQEDWSRDWNEDWKYLRMVDRIRYPTVSYLPFYYVFFQFLLLTIFNLQANILTTKDILSNLGWAGDVARRDVDSAVRRALDGIPDGRRSVGRPRVEGLDCGREDASNPGLEQDWHRRGWSGGMSWVFRACSQRSEYVLKGIIASKWFIANITLIHIFLLNYEYLSNTISPLPLQNNNFRLCISCLKRHLPLTSWNFNCYLIT